MPWFKLAPIIGWAIFLCSLNVGWSMQRSQCKGERSSRFILALIIGYTRLIANATNEQHTRPSDSRYKMRIFCVDAKYLSKCKICLKYFKKSENILRRCKILPPPTSTSSSPNSGKKWCAHNLYSLPLPSSLLLDNLSKIIFTFLTGVYSWMKFVLLLPASVQ